MPGFVEPECIAVSATFTAEPLEESLAFWASELGWRCEVRFAPYNQVFQQLLDPQSLLLQNRSGVNIVLVRPEDWIRFQIAGADAEESILHNARQLALNLREASKSAGIPVFVAVCPPSPAAPAGAVRMAEELLRSGLCGIPAVHWVGMDELLSLYPLAGIYDPHADELGHVPYTGSFFAALGTLCARKIHALGNARFKVAVLDCDNTLWQGVCGEDGPEGVTLDSRRRAFHEFMLAQREAGMLLCIASRNNEADVLDTFRAHPEFPLQLGHFTARSINWRDKAGNLASLADELELGLDSFIFIDDSAEECAAVQAACPEVCVLPFGELYETLPHSLTHLWPFDRLQTTAEDKQRSLYYQQQAQRAQLERQAGSLAEFIASLNLQVHISPAAHQSLARVSQLTLRTNQFNCTTVRRTEGEIAALIERGAECWTVEVADRFGAYGVTGVVILETRGAALWVDTFLLSCRVLGRGVEHKVLAWLGAMAQERGLASVAIPFAPTARNLPALLFLESAGLEFKRSAEDGTVFEFPAEFARSIEHHPGEKAAPPKLPRQPAVRERLRADYLRIATQLCSVDAIVENIRRRRPAAGAAPVEPEREWTVVEQQVGAIWRELLNVPEVGLNQSFFDLGGHSLLAIELLSRIRRAFQVELSLEVVYGAAFTVAGLAKAIEAEQIRQLGAAEYEALLEEIEALSDDEVRALLEREEAEGGAPGVR